MTYRNGGLVESTPRGGLAGWSVIGLTAQAALLAMLDATVGLGVAGWLAGIGFAVVTSALLGKALFRAGAAGLGPADVVTSARAILVGGVAALVTDAVTGPAPVRVVITLTVAALLLDAVDGRVARRTGTASALGARFDMEVDAFLILVLSIDLVRPLGSWVVAIGAMRYAFVLAGRSLPWLTAALPDRYSRKVVAAVQGIVLVAAVTGVLPAGLATGCVAAGLVLLCWSFGRDVVWLSRARRRPQLSSLLPVRAGHEQQLAA